MKTMHQIRLLEILTSESTKIIIDKTNNSEKEFYSIRHYDGYYGTTSTSEDLNSFQKCLKHLESSFGLSHDRLSCPSWWLNYPLLYIDDSIKPILKAQIEKYQNTKDIEKALLSSNNVGCILEWHRFLEVDYSALGELAQKKISPSEWTALLLHNHFHGLEYEPQKISNSDNGSHNRLPFTKKQTSYIIVLLLLISFLLVFYCT